MPPKVLLFDIGGVIVRWTGIAELAKHSGLPIDQVGSRFANSEICRLHERGRCEDDVFLKEMIEMLGLGFSQAEMKTLWNSWVGQPYDGVIDGLSILRRDYRLACLSNSNAMHWEHLNDYLHCHNIFDPCLASHQIHRAKPDLECFEYAIKKIGVEPEHILFLDDSAANVEAALSLGMQAHKIDPEEGGLPTLRRLGLL